MKNKDIQNYDKALIVSGDGDFFCLIEHLVDVGKLEKLIVQNDKYSSLLRKYAKYIYRLGSAQKKLQKRKERHSRGM